MTDLRQMAIDECKRLQREAAWLYDCGLLPYPEPGRREFFQELAREKYKHMWHWLEHRCSS